MQSVSRMIAVLTAGFLTALVITVPATTANATPPCASEVGVESPPGERNAREKTPVILVHGLWSAPTMWTKDSKMSAMLTEVPGAFVVKPFDYQASNSEWITTGNTSQRLAKTIVCYSKLYGGKKVIIVAHSMGGLLARAALDWSAYGTFARNATGHVITIGTPHLGTDLTYLQYLPQVALCDAIYGWRGSQAAADCELMVGQEAVSAMHPGSEELAKLPRFPAGVTVMAIAGEVIRRPCAPWGCGDRQSTGGDLVVPIASALSQYTATGVGDGKKVFGCEDPLALPLVSKPSCEHSELTRSPKVQDAVKASITAYLDSVKQKPTSASGSPTRTAPRSPSPSPTSSTVAYEFFGTMTLRLPSNMKVRATGGEGLSSYDVACADRSTCPSFAVYRPNEVGGNLGWQSWSFTRCPATQGTPSPAIVDKGTRRVGSKTARYYELQLCTDAQSQIARFWEVTDGSIFVMDVSDNSRWWPTEDAILAAATWR